MSHFSQLKTGLKHKETLLRALRRLGFEICEAEGGVEVRGFFGDTMPADFKVLTGTHYDIGFRLGESGNYEVIADWELMPKVAQIEQEDFNKVLKREYARESILETARQKGYEVQTVESEDGKTLEMVVTQW